MKRAKRISAGDEIAIVAPASPFDRSLFQASVAWLRKRGYRVRFDRGIFSKDDYLAGPDARRSSELSRAFGSPASAVFCARGGYGAMRLFLSQKPALSEKLFMGMSDVTPLLNAMAREHRMVSIHGPVLAGKLFSSLSESARGRLFSLLESPREQVLRSGTDFETVIDGSFQGTLWGGNLCLLAATMGTRAAVMPGRDAVLFLEEVDEPPYRVDRMLTQLALAGYLQRFSAIVLGDFTDTKGRRYRRGDLHALIFGLLGRKTPPILSGVASSHVRMKVLLPIGGQVRHHRGTLILPPLVS